MTAPASIPALIAEGRRLIAENDGKHRYCTMDPGPHAALRMLPALLDVAEAGGVACERLDGGAGEQYYREVVPGFVGDIEAIRSTLARLAEVLS